MYLIKTGPPISNSNSMPFQDSNPDTNSLPGNPQAIPIAPVQPNLNADVNLPDRRIGLHIRINGDMVWLVVKLGIALYFLTKNGTWSRTVFLASLAVLVFLFQSGILNIPARQQRSCIIYIAINEPVVEQPQGDGDQVLPQQQGENPPEVPPERQTLLGFIGWLAYTFFISMFPEAEPAAN
jgi:hypothetical protein